MLRTLALATALILGTTAASAAPLTPTYTTFEDLPQANFGGTGIPTAPTAITTFNTSGGSTVTLAMSATQRFFNPALTNDNAGTYFATTGANTGGPNSTSNVVGTLWNFNFFASVDPGTDAVTLADLGLQLLYDLDPGTDTDSADLGVFGDPALAFYGYQGSQNLNFTYLAAGVPGAVTAPTFNAFDPNAPGEYSFALQSTAFSEQVSINVNVSAVPLPASLPLLLAAFGGVALLRRK